MAPTPQLEAIDENLPAGSSIPSSRFQLDPSTLFVRCCEVLSPWRHPRCSRISREMPSFPMLDSVGQRPVPTTSSAVNAPYHPRIPTDYCSLSCSPRNQRHSLLSLTRSAWKSGLGGNPRYTNVEEAKYGCSRRLCVARLGKQPDRPLTDAESSPFGLVRSLLSWFRVPVATHCTSH